MLDVVWLTLRLATATTLILLVLATPLALWLSHRGSWVKEVVGAVVALPIVLPPTVLGFYLLLAFGPQSLLAGLWRPFGLRSLAFTFEGLVAGSVIYSLPFAVQPLRVAFQSLAAGPREVAATLGASPWDAFWTVTLPLARRGYMTAGMLVFAHTIGEFGVALMIGGAIPGETEVLSIRLWELVEASRWSEAHALAGALAGVAFFVALTALVLDRRSGRS